MSPAFLNRFDIIFLDNQLENIKSKEFINLLSILFTKKEEKSQVDDELDEFCEEESDEENKLFGYFLEDKYLNLKYIMDINSY